MKLKKFVTSKPFMAGSLAVLCVGILVVCLILQGNEKTEFVPDPASSITPVDSWSEKTSPAISGTTIETRDNVAASTPEKEEYPKVVESDDNETKVEFTDPSPEKLEAPDTPEGKTELEDPGSSHPVQKDPTVIPTPSKQQSKQETMKEVKKNTKQETKQETKKELKPPAPAPGSKNEKGQVYDPAFGWITIEEGVGIPTDNDGDPDKQIGSMD